MSSECIIFARFSKCRPKEQFLRDFQNVDRKHNFGEIVLMSTENTNFERFSKCRPKAQFLRDFAMESYLRLRRGVRICGHRWVALARRPSSMVVGWLEERLPLLDLSPSSSNFTRLPFQQKTLAIENSLYFRCNSFNVHQTFIRNSLCR